MSLIDDLPEVLTVEEAARALRVHPASIRRMCRSGELRCVRILNRWRIPKSEVARLLQPITLAGGRSLSQDALREAAERNEQSRPARSEPPKGEAPRGDPASGSGERSARPFQQVRVIG